MHLSFTWEGNVYKSCNNFFFFFNISSTSKTQCSGDLLISWGRMGGQVVAHPNTAMIGSRMDHLHCFNNSIQLQNELKFPLFCFNFMLWLKKCLMAEQHQFHKKCLKMVCHLYLPGCEKWKQIVIFSPKAVNYTISLSSQQNRSFRKWFINSATETATDTFKSSRYCYFQGMTSLKHTIHCFY